MTFRVFYILHFFLKFFLTNYIRLLNSPVNVRFFVQMQGVTLFVRSKVFFLSGFNFFGDFSGVFFVGAAHKKLIFDWLRPEVRLTVL